MISLVKLEDYRPKQNADAVSMLEEALELAKSGELKAVTVAAALQGGTRFVSVSDGAEHIEMIGLLERAKFLCNEALNAEMA